MTSSSLPTISIIMPVLNRNDTLEKAILSVLSQEYKRIEFIILDGGSTDGSVDIIKRYAAHLTYWHSQSDGGPTVAMNMGIEKATGDIIAILMADDWYAPSTLQKIADAYLSYPEADMFTCGGCIERYDASSQRYQRVRTFNTARSLFLSFYTICFAASAICCRFIKKSFYQQIGVYQPFDANGKIFLSNDKEFLLRAVIHHAKDVFVDYTGHHYLAHSASSTFSRHRGNTLKMCEEHMATAQYYFSSPRLTLSQRACLKYWYYDQATRIVLYRLLDRQFSSARLVFQRQCSQSHVVWLFFFSFTAATIVVKKMVRAVKSIFIKAYNG